VAQLKKPRKTTLATLLTHYGHNYFRIILTYNGASTLASTPLLTG